MTTSYARGRRAPIVDLGAFAAQVAAAADAPLIDLPAADEPIYDARGYQRPEQTRPGAGRGRTPKNRGRLGQTAVAQPRLLEPPRVPGFCPATHCARPCGADCTCKPCRCGCVRRASRIRRVSGSQVARSAVRQDRLFAIADSRSTLS